MAFFDAITKRIHCNIIYWGPAMGGKTSSLRQIAHYHAVYDRLICPMQRYATETARFQGCSILGQQRIDDWQFHLHCLGQEGVAMDSTLMDHWISIADAVVFVADSQRHKLQENIKKLQHVAKIQAQNHRNLAQLPLVLQYNKRDMEDILSIEKLQSHLNPLAWNYSETNAFNGSPKPIVDALNMVEMMIGTNLRHDGFPR